MTRACSRCPVRSRHLSQAKRLERTDAGRFGAAETADGTLRLIGPDEARQAGLLDGTYRQTCNAVCCHAAWLQKLLDDEVDRS
jgi:hypothetical protein